MGCLSGVALIGARGGGNMRFVLADSPGLALPSQYRKYESCTESLIFLYLVLSVQYLISVAS